MLAFVTLAVCLTCSHAFAASYKSTDGSLVVNASDIGYGTGRVIATGSAYVKQVDKIKKTTFEAYAAKIVVIFAETPVASAGVNKTSIKSADLSGPVKLIYVTVDPKGVTSKVTSTADNANYDGKSQLAYLKGHVNITNENSSLFDTPAVMTGDKATVNLDPNLGPDDIRFKVESAPGLSTITATPKAKTQDQEK